jgi:biotin carboxyl carrier protein
MNVRVKIDDQVFEVEIDDVRARPVTARIGAEVFEIWPDEPASGPAQAAAPPPATPAPAPAHTNGAARRPATNGAAKDAGDAIRAPLPGVLLSVAVAPGDQVTTGQPLCVLEAMKMNNTIRAARAGRIAAVRVTPGQTVSHRQVLMEYEPG